MSRKHRRFTLAAIVLALAVVAAAPLAIRARGTSTPDKVWGTPRAEIFDSPKAGGPLVEGDAVTYLPYVAELKRTNVPERAGRAQDQESEDAFEKLRRDGYM